MSDILQESEKLKSWKVSLDSHRLDILNSFEKLTIDIINSNKTQPQIEEFIYIDVCIRIRCTDELNNYDYESFD